MHPNRQATSLAFFTLVLALSSPAQVIDWSQRSPAASPSPRQGHAMVYDSLRGKTVLFGESVAPCTTTGATTARNTIPIPNLPSMVGLPFFLQACAPAPGANPAELLVSNALRLVIRS